MGCKPARRCLLRSALRFGCSRHGPSGAAADCGFNKRAASWVQCTTLQAATGALLLAEKKNSVALLAGPGAELRAGPGAALQAEIGAALTLKPVLHCGLEPARRCGLEQELRWGLEPVWLRAGPRTALRA